MQLVEVASYSSGIQGLGLYKSVCVGHCQKLKTWFSYIRLSFPAGEFETLEITALSSPPELPDVMKPQESSSAHTQEQTAS